jgi:hypothetical protein
MSAPVNTPATARQDRNVTATKRFCEVLGLPVLTAKELKHLTTALAEAATEEVRRNPAFGERIRAIFREVSEVAAPPRSSGAARGRQAKPKLVPLGLVDPGLFGPDKPVDPYVLHVLYGDAQLRLALSSYPAATLKKAAAIVEQNHSGTMPTGRSTKAALIDYIVQYVTAGGN